MKLCNWEVGATQPLFLIAGPCVIESATMTLKIAETLQKITTELNMPFIFKASFDKANRSTITSFRGLGVETGLRILDQVRTQIGVPVLTDVHEDSPLDEITAVVDILQTPAFLCRYS